MVVGRAQVVLAGQKKERPLLIVTGRKCPAKIETGTETQQTPKKGSC